LTRCKCPQTTSIAIHCNLKNRRGNIKTTFGTVQHALLDAINPLIEHKVQEIINNGKKVQTVINNSVQETMIKNCKLLYSVAEPLQTKISLQESEVTDLEMTIGIQVDVLESQQQYTRRTCLKFLKIPVPIGQTPRTFDPLKSVLGICHDLRSIELTPQVSCCHVLGQLKDNKVNVIAGFVWYYDRENMYSAKRKLKGNLNGTMVVEALQINVKLL